MNVDLKTAIIRSRKTQRQIARETQILENRLSSIVRGWAEPRADERARLVRALGCSADIFSKSESGGRR